MIEDTYTIAVSPIKNTFLDKIRALAQPGLERPAVVLMNASQRIRWRDDSGNRLDCYPSTGYRQVPCSNSCMLWYVWWKSRKSDLGIRLGVYLFLFYLIFWYRKNKHWMLMKFVIFPNHKRWTCIFTLYCHYMIY